MQLPENAFRELKEGEQYEPVLDANKVYPEVNAWSVTWGVIMAMIFSAAAAYLGLKVGQVFEAAIPIAIIAVGASTVAKRKGALGENIIIQSIGACSGAVVAGAILPCRQSIFCRPIIPQSPFRSSRCLSLRCWVAS